MHVAGDGCALLRSHLRLSRCPGPLHRGASLLGRCPGVLCRLPGLLGGDALPFRGLGLLSK